MFNEESWGGGEKQQKAQIRRTHVKNDECAALWFFGLIHLAPSKLHLGDVDGSANASLRLNCRSAFAAPSWKHLCRPQFPVCSFLDKIRQQSRAQQEGERHDNWLPVKLNGKAGGMRRWVWSQGVWSPGWWWGRGQSSVDGRSFQSNQGSVDGEAQNCHYSRAQSHSQPERRAAQVWAI